MRDHNVNNLYKMWKTEKIIIFYTAENNKKNMFFSIKTSCFLFRHNTIHNQVNRWYAEVAERLSVCMTGKLRAIPGPLRYLVLSKIGNSADEKLSGKTMKGY